MRRLMWRCLLAGVVTLAATTSARSAQGPSGPGPREALTGLDPILLAGGMLKESPWLSAEMGRRLAEVAPRARVEPLTHEPVFGAVRLALAEASGGVRVPQYVDAIQSPPAPQTRL